MKLLQNLYFFHCFHTCRKFFFMVFGQRTGFMDPFLSLKEVAPNHHTSTTLWLMVGVWWYGVTQFFSKRNHLFDSRFNERNILQEVPPMSHQSCTRFGRLLQGRFSKLSDLNVVLWSFKDLRMFLKPFQTKTPQMYSSRNNQLKKTSWSCCYK